MGVLEDLPTKLSHDIKVPFTKMAFFDGQIIHTNEVVMHLGAEWFAGRGKNISRIR
jgi:unconventional prefoldin RPB5 interactor 1